MLWGVYGDLPHLSDVMTLVALLSAQLAAVDAPGDGAEAQLAAVLPIAGMTVIERQAEAAIAAGCMRILILVDRVPAALVTAIDQLRATGMAVTTVRDGGEVIAALAASDGGRVPRALVLVADGLIAPASAWVTLTAASAPTVLAVADSPATSALERIDGQWRWAGLASVPASDAALLDEIPVDWDPQLALLRNAIQQSAPIMTCDAALFERGDIVVIDQKPASDLAEQRMLSVAADHSAGLINAAIVMPVARMLVKPLLKQRYSATIAYVTALAGAMAAAGALWLHRPMLAAFCALAGVAGAGAAAAIATFRVETALQQRLAALAQWVGYAAIAMAGIAGRTGASGWTLAERGGLSVSLMLLIMLAGRLARRGMVNRRLAPDGGMVWMILALGAGFNLWTSAIIGAVVLAIALLLIALQRQGTPPS